MKNRSLRFRLSFSVTVLLLLAWLVALTISWFACREYINRFFDTEMIQYTRTPAITDPRSFTEGRLPGPKEFLPGLDKEFRGKEEEGALSYAVFTMDGELVIANGKKGEGFRFDPYARGLAETRDKGRNRSWRMYYAPSVDGNHLIVVGQETKFRRSMALGMLWGQAMPWLVILPVIIGLIILVITRELAPLKDLSAKLAARGPGDLSGLDQQCVTPEVKPFVDSLNSLFEKIGNFLTRERAFISDAAHELRTPLAAVRVQAEVARLAEEEKDPQARREALDNIITGTERTGRMLEQLLNLSRLEAADSPGGAGSTPEMLDWPALVEEALTEQAETMDARHLRIEVGNCDHPPAMPGNPAFIRLMLRNLLDNAARYTPEGGRIAVTLAGEYLRVQNSGDVDNASMLRLGEKFFRPPGQAQTGSGLGLSLVKRIAELHGFALELSSSHGASGQVEPESLFTATIRFTAGGHDRQAPLR